MNQKFIGATLLIAGTTIGAGMLALPMTSAQFGLSKSLFLLIGMWIYMMYAAYIMVEISHGKGRSIATIAEERFGAFAKNIAAFSLLMLFWSLLSAYISGSASILHQNSHIKQPFLAIAYTCLFGFFVVSCTKAVDYANRFLFIAKCVAFFVIIMIMSPFVTFKNLTSQHVFTSMSLYYAIPIFFASFGFHGSLPSLINYLDGDKKIIYKSIFIGSAIPLIVYGIWQALTLGVLGNVFENTGDVGIFIAQLASKTGYPSFSLVMNIFTFLVIATSFLGVAMGLFDYISEWFVDAHQKRAGASSLTSSKRLIVALLTFLLPLIFSLFYPEGFVFALGFAAIALSVLAIILPCLVAFGEKSSSFFMNKWVVSVILLGGIAVVVIEVMSKL